MAKTAILSDVHSNLPALEAVLRGVEASGAEGIVFLGDLVGYGASPAECVERVRHLGAACVMGNHDIAIQAVRKRGCRCIDPDWKNSGYLAGLVHSAKALNEDQASWLARLPFILKIPGAWVAHASLDEPENFNLIESAESAEPTLAILRSAHHKVGFFGHTHVQEVFPDLPGELEWLDESRFKIPAGLACAVMVGSVGQPRHETDRRACWVLWDSTENIVEFRKTTYDRVAAAKSILEGGLPLESAVRLLMEHEIAILDA